MKNLQPVANRSEAPRGSNLAQVKTAQLAREEEEKKRLQRLRGLVVLIERFLLDQGYVQSLSWLQQESSVSLQAYTPADNMDLLTVLTEFEQYYEFKYQRKPKLFRARNGDDESVATVVNSGGEKMLVRKNRAGGGSHPSTAVTKSSAAAAAATHQGDHFYGAGENGGPAASPSSGASPSVSGGAAAQKHLRPTGNLARALAASAVMKGSASNAESGKGKGGTSGGSKDDGSVDSLTLAGQKVNMHTAAEDDAMEGDDAGEAPLEYYNGRALRPLPVFPTPELNDLASTILRDILDVNPAVRWSDIAELDSAKHLLQEAVVMPVKYPELFEGILRPWKGILLFGPPGTGKTLLAKAVATECKTTFFNISASSVVSKWRGDSEKLVRMLFELAVHYSPSTIFIDEVDSLMSARSSDGEHEGSRRMKTELLSQMDGLSKRRGGDVVFVLAASNTPWDLDTAMLRRLEKRVLVSLPTPRARELMFRKLLCRNALAAAPAAENQSSPGHGENGSAVSQPMDWSACAQLSAGMSGADIDIVCREAMMRPIRKMIEKLEASRTFKKGSDQDRRRDSLRDAKLEKPNVTLADVEASIAATRSSVSQEDLKRYDMWMATFGSGISS